MGRSKLPAHYGFKTKKNIARAHHIAVSRRSTLGWVPSGSHSTFGQKGAEAPDTDLDKFASHAFKTFYDYADIKSFWVDDNHPHTKLVLISHKSFSPHIVVPVDDITHPIDITDYLIHYIPQVRGEETFFHKLLEQIGL